MLFNLTLWGGGPHFTGKKTAGRLTSQTLPPQGGGGIDRPYPIDLFAVV